MNIFKKTCFLFFRQKQNGAKCISKNSYLPSPVNQWLMAENGSIFRAGDLTLLRLNILSLFTSPPSSSYIVLFPCPLNSLVLQRPDNQPEVWIGSQSCRLGSLFHLEGQTAKSKNIIYFCNISFVSVKRGKLAASE